MSKRSSFLCLLITAACLGCVPLDGDAPEIGEQALAAGAKAKRWPVESGNKIRYYIDTVGTLASLGAPYTNVCDNAVDEPLDDDMPERIREAVAHYNAETPLVFEEVETFREEGHFDADLLTVTWLFHPVRSGRFDLQVGPLLSLARYDTDVGDDRDEELGWGGRLGLEMGLGEASPWSLGLEIRHLELVHEKLDHDYYGDLGLDIAAVTIGYRTGAAR